jgi:hypothetical protein
LFLVTALAGCGRDQIKVYRVAKEKTDAPAAVASPQVENPPAMPEAQPRLTWTLPAGWEQVPPGEMRLASFKVKGQDGKQADVSVVPLPGMAGGDLNNVNRWRGQVDLPPVKQEELDALAEKVDAGGAEAVLYDQAGQNPGSDEKTRILATILRRDNTAWFFKMTGDSDLVARQKPAFIEFLKSLRFATGEAAPALPPSHPPIGGVAEAMPNLPPSHPPIGGSIGGSTDALPAADAGAKPNWTVPATWKEEPPTQMLIAKFIAADADAKAEITVSSFPGDVGGLLANVNRWRRQLGLPGIEEADLSKTVSEIEAQGGKATLVELDGADARTGQKTKLVGVILPQVSQTWFYKMMGDEKVVAREKNALIQFVQSVKQ